MKNQLCITCPPYPNTGTLFYQFPLHRWFHSFLRNFSCVEVVMERSFIAQYNQKHIAVIASSSRRNSLPITLPLWYRSWSDSINRTCLLSQSFRSPVGNLLEWNAASATIAWSHIGLTCRRRSAWIVSYRHPLKVIHDVRRMMMMMMITTDRWWRILMIHRRPTMVLTVVWTLHTNLPPPSLYLRRPFMANNEVFMIW